MLHRRRRRPRLRPLRSLRRRDRLPPDRRRPRQRPHRLGPSGNRLANPLQSRTQAAAGSQRRRPHRPARGRGERHEGPAAGRTETRLRQARHARRLAAAKADAGRRTARPRILRPQRDRREGPMRSEVPRHGRHSDRRRDPPVARRSARLPESLVLQRPTQRPAGACRQTARAMGARLAGSFAQRLPLVAGQICRRASTASCKSRTAASSRRRRRTIRT